VIDACEQPARSGAHGFRSHRPRSLLTLRKFCRIRADSSGPKAPRETRLLIVEIFPLGSREHENHGRSLATHCGEGIVRVYRIADLGLIGQISLEDYPSAGFERLFDCRTRERCK
jgi:hypothetical protein